MRRPETIQRPVESKPKVLKKSAVTTPAAAKSAPIAKMNMTVPTRTVQNPATSKTIIAALYISDGKPLDVTRPSYSVSPVKMMFTSAMRRTRQRRNPSVRWCGGSSLLVIESSD